MAFVEMKAIIINFLSMLAIAECSWSPWHPYGTSDCYANCRQRTTLVRNCNTDDSCLGDIAKDVLTWCQKGNCNPLKPTKFVQGDWQPWVNYTYDNQCAKHCFSVDVLYRTCMPEDACEGVHLKKVHGKCAKGTCPSDKKNKTTEAKTDKKTTNITTD